MANSKYSALEKDALVNEVKTRREAGRSIAVDLRGSEEKLRAALDTDDMENGDFDPNAKPSETAPGGTAKPPLAPPTTQTPPAQVTAPKPKVSSVPQNLRNQVAHMPESPLSPTQPSDEDFAAGSLARNKSDGFIYQVVKKAGDDFNKPVKCRVPAQDSGHNGFYWEGSEEEFAGQFEKV